MTEQPISKVLILDDSMAHADAIKTFCNENKLVALKVREENLMSILRSNIDLGAILYSENYGASAAKNAEIALRIHILRPELPIILRRNVHNTLDGIDESLRQVYCAAYTTDDLSGLSKVIDEYIFSLVYPNALVRGISEITEGVLTSQFRELLVRWDTPYIVRDRVIFGEVFSLIPLESSWCRGFMMLQTEEQPILDILGVRNSAEVSPDFRQVNSLLGEITNLIWGGFKS
ncbi:MAG: chemotaxis protein CheX, partial [Betaproteobacteria bacterium]